MATMVAALLASQLPADRPVVLIFIDDLHINFRDTGYVRELLRTVTAALIREGDQFTVVSSGPGSIHIPLTADRRRLDDALKRVTGGGLRPTEILDPPDATGGTNELRLRGDMAMSALSGMLKNVESLNGRRKTVIYISNGYDVEETDLVQLTQRAKRSGTTLYPIHPRAFGGRPPLDLNVDATAWERSIGATQRMLRTLADLTGGVAVFNPSDWKAALQRMDASEPR
jgi:VWFA-related protein